MTANPHAAPRSARGRKPFVIRQYLDEVGITMADIARDLEVSHTLVSRTVRGTANSRRVLEKLMEIGVPSEAINGERGGPR